MSQNFPDSIDDFSPRDREDYLGGPEIEEGVSVTNFFDHGIEYDESVSDCEFDMLNDGQDAPAIDDSYWRWHKRMSEEAQMDVVRSYLQWEHVISIARRHKVTVYAVASILNERGAAFYSAEYLPNPWGKLVGKKSQDDLEYFMTEAIQEEYVDLSWVTSETSILRDTSWMKLFRGGDWVNIDSLSPADKRRLIRCVAGVMGPNEGVALASRLRDYRMIYLLALQQRDTLVALEALNAQAMHLQRPFAIARAILINHVGENLSNSLLTILRKWLALALLPQASLAEIDIPDEVGSVDFHREYAACHPAKRGRSRMVEVVLAIGERDYRKLEEHAQAGCRLSKFYCVDRSLRAMKAGDRYRCKVDWATDLGEWCPDLSWIDGYTKVMGSDIPKPLISLLTERMMGDYGREWRPPFYFFDEWSDSEEVGG